MDLFEFLWKWKVSTTALLSALCYPDRTPKKAYYRLRYLEQGGYLQTKFCTRKCIWTLTKKGYLSIKERLPELSEDGFLSESPGHDLLASAVQLGPGLSSRMDCLEVFTEQELRRYAPHAYPDWVPRVSSHRPDGFWRTASATESRTIALEVELKEKGRDDYLSVSTYYEHQRTIELVIWVVKTLAAARRIQSHLSNDFSQLNKHAFLSIPTFFEDGWHSPIELGAEQNRALRDVLGYGSSTGRVLVPAALHLNVSKSPHRSTACRVYSISDSFH